MKVAFDTWGLNVQARHQGIYLYSLMMLTELNQLGKEHGDLMIEAFAGERSGSYDTDVVAPGPHLQYITTKWLDNSRAWRFLKLKTVAADRRAQVLFVPHGQCISMGSRIPIVSTIHDATPVRVPGQMHSRLTLQLKTYLWFAVRYSRRIIAVSETTKRDLIELYGVDPDRVHVTYLGYKPGVFNLERPNADLLVSLNNRFGISRPYLFHHGAVQPRKNLGALIEAHRVLLDRHSDLEIDLVLAGPMGWLYEPILEAAARSGTRRGRVIFTGTLEEAELVALLKAAALGVFPSLYEGFCLPMLESMACGIPTVVSRASCLPEISGGVLRYFAPDSIEEMVEVLTAGLLNAAERARLREEGLRRAACFSWRRCAEQTLEVIRQTAA